MSSSQVLQRLQSIEALLRKSQGLHLFLFFLSDQGGTRSLVAGPTSSEFFHISSPTGNRAPTVLGDRLEFYEGLEDCRSPEKPFGLFVF